MKNNVCIINFTEFINNRFDYHESIVKDLTEQATKDNEIRQRILVNYDTEGYVIFDLIHYQMTTEKLYIYKYTGTAK